MNLSTDALYELAFATSALLASVLAAVTVFGLRYILRGWQSRWRKTCIVHGANLAVLMVAFPRLADHLPLAGYLGLVLGGSLNFWLACLIADIVRFSTLDSSAPIDRSRSWRAIALAVLVMVAGFGGMRLMARSADGKQALEMARLAIPVMQALRQRSPEREVLAAMASSFPDELEKLLQGYLTEVMALKEVNPGQLLLPKFPLKHVTLLIRERRHSIASAPDAELVALARTLPSHAALFEANSEHCAGVGREGVVFREPFSSQATDPATREALGHFLAAALTAARAGSDHPIKRIFTDERTAELDARFAKAFPQVAALDQTGPDAGPAQCRVLAARMRWIGELPPDDAAYLIALLSSSEAGLPAS